MRHLRNTDAEGPGRTARRAVALSGVLAVVAAGLVALVGSAVPAAAAVPATAHEPIGGSLVFKADPAGLRVSGWAADPDQLAANVAVYAVVDGYATTVRTTTSYRSPRIAARYHTGPTPGFVLTVPLSPGNHIVCVAVASIGPGIDSVLGCSATPVGRTLTAAQTAARSPRGQLLGARATSSSLTFSGWASDPDYVNRRTLTVLYVDGSPAATGYTGPTPTPRPAGAGRKSAFTITVPVSSGMHIGCVWAVNTGIGSNTFLGCDALDTRGPAGSGALPAPKLNAAVVAEAKKHIGQAYVWGAQGPKTFDCSGLVLYSYTKAQQATKTTLPFTVPRVSEAQALQARLIPADRAVPGDLVFTHDSEGDVYHVGIYIKPGVALAAIDYGYGVNYQNIWDPASTTYGSFTHT